MSSTSFIRPLIIHADYPRKDTVTTWNACHCAYRADRSISRDTRLCVHAYARRKRAHTGAAHAEAQSQLCTPTRTAFIHKSSENGRASLTPHRAAPCFSPRPFTSGAYAASRRRGNAHARRHLRAGERDCVLMAAIAIDVRSKFKRTYFPNRGDRAAGAALLLLYLERASDRRQNPREWITIPRASCARIATEREREKRTLYVSHIAMLQIYIRY